MIGPKSVDPRDWISAIARADALVAAEGISEYLAIESIAALTPGDQSVSSRKSRRTLTTLRVGSFARSLSEQDCLQRSRVPCAAGDEVLKLVVPDLAVARRHWLDALAISRADQIKPAS